MGSEPPHGTVPFRGLQKAVTAQDPLFPPDLFHRIQSSTTLSATKLGTTPLHSGKNFFFSEEVCNLCLRIIRFKKPRKFKTIV